MSAGAQSPLEAGGPPGSPAAGAHNGAPSRSGAAQLHPSARQRAFAHWFKGSKVVDADGAPLVLYHGTRASFDAFSYARIGQHGCAEGAGFYFTVNQGPSLASNAINAVATLPVLLYHEASR